MCDNLALDEVQIHVHSPDSKQNGEDTNLNGSVTNNHQVHVPLHLKFDGLTVKAGEKTILSNVSGEFKPGEMVAIMGPSGMYKNYILFSLFQKS